MDRLLIARLALTLQIDMTFVGKPPDKALHPADDLREIAVGLCAAN